MKLKIVFLLLASIINEAVSDEAPPKRLDNGQPLVEAPPAAGGTSISDDPGSNTKDKVPPVGPPVTCQDRNDLPAPPSNPNEPAPPQPPQPPPLPPCDTNGPSDPAVDPPREDPGDVDGPVDGGVMPPPNVPPPPAAPGPKADDADTVDTQGDDFNGGGMGENSAAKNPNQGNSDRNADFDDAGMPGTASVPASTLASVCMTLLATLILNIL